MYGDVSVQRVNTMGDEEGSGGAESRPMWDATCSSCGAATKVPFQPKEGRPVYCKDCYKKRRRL